MHYNAIARSVMPSHRPENIAPVAVLKVLRDGTVGDWRGLVSEFQVQENTRGKGRLAQIVVELARADLVSVETLAGPWSEPAGRISITARWSQVQRALDISLTSLARSVDDGLFVTPEFGPSRVLAIDIFVLMSFQPQLKPVYEDHIGKVARNLGLLVKRADDLFTAHSVVADIWSGIRSARVIIADCTGRNPNVFYEIGIAHTIGKPVILITQTNDDVPFDLRSIRYIPYEFTPRGMMTFEANLAKTLHDVLSAKPL